MTIMASFQIFKCPSCRAMLTASETRPTGEPGAVAKTCPYCQTELLITDDPLAEAGFRVEPLVKH